MKKIYIVVAENSYGHYDAYLIMLVTDDKDKAILFAKSQDLIVGNALSVRYLVHERDLNIPSVLNDENVIFERSSEDIN